MEKKKIQLTFLSFLKYTPFWILRWFGYICTISVRLQEVWGRVGGAVMAARKGSFSGLNCSLFSVE